MLIALIVLWHILEMVWDLKLPNRMQLMLLLRQTHGWKQLAMPMKMLLLELRV